MPADVVVLVATAVLAVVAVVAAVVAVRAARRLARTQAATPVPTDATQAEVGAAAPPTSPGDAAEVVVVVEPDVSEAHVVEGRVVRPPTQHQVVTAAMGRPQVRATVLVRGVAHALRPESRDRIAGLVRREYRQRRRERLRAGRRAARAAGPSAPPASSDQWLGET